MLLRWHVACVLRVVEIAAGRDAARGDRVMDTALVSALAAVLGSLVGGSATVATAWVTQRTHNRYERMDAELRLRESLYTEFIRESSKLVVDSFAHELESPETLVTVYELINRIRLSASDTVLAEAEEALRQITEQYFSPNLSIEDFRELVRLGTADPIKRFGEACRRELHSGKYATGGSAAC
jgi:hypothetical protein